MYKRKILDSVLNETKINYDGTSNELQINLEGPGFEIIEPCKNLLWLSNEPRKNILCKYNEPVINLEWVFCEHTLVQWTWKEPVMNIEWTLIEPFIIIQWTLIVLFKNIMNLTWTSIIHSYYSSRTSNEPRITSIGFQMNLE